MKKIILFVLATQQLISFGQSSPCVNEVSTDPEDPYNSSLPLDTTTNIAFDSLFLNQFNWVPFGSQNNLMDLQTVDLPGLGSNQQMRPLYDNPGGFYGYINNEFMEASLTDPGIIPNHQHGWELIGVNLGFFPDNTPYTDVPDVSNQYPTMPYVILYHRYLSKIRVFVNVHDQWALGSAYQAARIRLTLNTDNDRELNGLFRLLEGTDRTLDQPTETRSIGVVTGVNNDKQRWIIGDFTVAFDPCVCDYPSAFNVDVELVKNWDFELYGRSISTEEEIIDENGSFINNNFLSGVSVDHANPEVNEGGFVMYKKMEDLFDDYIKRMEHYDSTLAAVNKHNDRVERNLAITRWVKYAIDVGVTAATGGSSTAVSLVGNVLQHAPDLFGSDTTATGLSENWDKAFKEAEKIIGKEAMTFINDNFKTQEPPSTPNKPTANFSEMYFEGRLTQVDPKPGPLIFTPGTYGNSINTFITNQHRYPVYNEPLGVFALLERPKVKISQTDILNDSECYNYSSTPFSYYIEHTLPDGEVVLQWIDIEVPFKKASIFKKIQLKLKDKLSYTFNPALNIKDYNIEASFDVKLNKNEGSEDYPIDSYNFGDIDFKENVIINNYPKHNVNIESINYNTEIGELLSGVDTLRFNTVYQPIDAILSTTYSFGQEV